MVEYIEDFLWEKDMKVKDFLDKLGNIGFQAKELRKGADVILKMKKEGAKVFFTFTSNMVTSGLRGLFSQLFKYKLVNVGVTTVGAIEEDIMKALGEKFVKSNFNIDDFDNYERGNNRVGNIIIKNNSYLRFEDYIHNLLLELYKIKKKWTPSELFFEIGKKLNDENSILYQASKNNIPIFCPGITDGAFGYHLFLFQQDHPDFIIDVVQDFRKIVLITDYNDKKGIISLGGSISKHHALLSVLLNGGAEFLVYMTTSKDYSGSLSGSTTSEAKSWGKAKSESDIVTIYGDVSITFPLMISYVFDEII